MYLRFSPANSNATSRSQPPAEANEAIRCKASVVPDMAESTTTPAPSRTRISATRLMWAALPTEVPPNFKTFIIPDFLSINTTYATNILFLFFKSHFYN